MKCDLCGKKASVHLTEIVDGSMTELHLCEICAREKSVQMEQQFGLADLLAGLSDFGKQVKENEKELTSCSNCGTNYEDFKKLGRLGCSECYATFRDKLSVLLKKIHGSNRHLGKMLEKPEAEMDETEDAVDNIVEDTVENKLDGLRKQLEQAIRIEDFEKAAELRDKIRASEKKGDQ